MHENLQHLLQYCYPSILAFVYRYLVNQGCIKPLYDLLVCTEPIIVTVCLEGLENILKFGETEKDLGNTGGVNLYAQFIDDAEGLGRLRTCKVVTTIRFMRRK